jgi:hypothetical protein
LHVEVNDDILNSVTYGQRIGHQTSGTAAANFGTGIEFELEDAGGGTDIAASIETIWSTATASSEQSSLQFKTTDVADDGLATRVTIDKDGHVGIGDPTPEYFMDIYSGNGDHPFMAHSAGTVDPVVINSDGRVGIGTPSPYGTSTEHKVTITAGSSGVGAPDADSVLIVENDADVSIQLLSPDGNTQRILFGDATSVNVGSITYNHGSDIMELATNGVAAVTIDSSQKVGIGTGSPDNPLELLSSTTPQFRITNTDATDYATFSVDTDGQFDITTVDGVGTGGHINLMPDGNVGIGTTSPDNLLAIYGATPIVDIETSDSTVIDGDDLGTIQFRGLDATQTHLVGAMIRAQAAETWGGTDEDDSPTELQFFTEEDGDVDHLSTPRMVISQIGNVGIGTTTPKGALNVDNTGESKGEGVSIDTYHTQTDDNNWHTIATINTDDDEVIGLIINIIAIDDANDNAAHYFFPGSFNNEDGTLSHIAVYTNMFHDVWNNANWDHQFVISGTDILIQVKGDTDETVEWQATVEKHVVDA